MITAPDDAAPALAPPLTAARPAASALEFPRVHGHERASVVPHRHRVQRRHLDVRNERVGCPQWCDDDAAPGVVRPLAAREALTQPYSRMRLTAACKS